MDPPSAQAMTADPSVVDAAVRFCDDALASPTVEFLKPVESNVKIINNFWSKTVTIPIATFINCNTKIFFQHARERKAFWKKNNPAVLLTS